MRNTLLLITLALFCSCNNTQQVPHTQVTEQRNNYQPTQKSEFDVAKTIIVHEPAGEILPGMLHPRAALFDIYFNISESQQEHQNYVRELRNTGAEVIGVKEALESGCIDQNGNEIDGAALDSLRAFAYNILTYDTSNLAPELQQEQEEYKKEIITELSVAELIDIMIMQPTIILHPTAHNTGITATYQYNPLMNLFYTRDQMITTAKGIVISKMNSPQRQNECEIMKFALQKLGIDPLYQVEGEGAFLEGGDLLSYPNISFIGCGMRTTRTAIDQLLERDLFGTERVAIVYDRRFSQAEMHLDTYFNIIDSDLATISEARLLAPEHSNLYLEMDIFTREDGKYRLTESRKFIEFLQQDLGMTLIPIPSSDQERLAGNFLTVAPRKIMAVANQSEEFEKRLQENGVSVTWIPLENLIKGYGAAHCMTQVIERK
ncbi:MAG: arginine deiminase family protein [Rikenellaceae bacterium]